MRSSTLAAFYFVVCGTIVSAEPVVPAGDANISYSGEILEKVPLVPRSSRGGYHQPSNRPTEEEERAFRQQQRRRRQVDLEEELYRAEQRLEDAERISAQSGRSRTRRAAQRSARRERRLINRIHRDLDQLDRESEDDAARK